MNFFLAYLAVGAVIAKLNVGKFIARKDVEPIFSDMVQIAGLKAATFILFMVMSIFWIPGKLLGLWYKETK